MLLIVSVSQTQTHCHARISAEDNLGVLSNEIKGLTDFFGGRLNRPKALNLPQGSGGVSRMAAFPKKITTTS